MSQVRRMTHFDMPPTPKGIFDRFLEGLPVAGIDKFESSEPWTRYATEFFRKWGKDLGYTVFCKEKYGGDGEYLSIDLTWMKQAADQRFVDLAMEHENHYPDVFEDELQKLMDLKSLLKVLITYISEDEYRDDFVAKVAWAIRMRSLRLPEERYLVMVGCCPKGKKPTDHFVLFYGYAFDNTGCLIERFESPIITLHP
jgi:hypothetical protein